MCERFPKWKRSQLVGYIEDLEAKHTAALAERDAEIERLMKVCPPKTADGKYAGLRNQIHFLSHDEAGWGSGKVAGWSRGMYTIHCEGGYAYHAKAADCFVSLAKIRAAAKESPHA